MNPNKIKVIQYKWCEIRNDNRWFILTKFYIDSKWEKKVKDQIYPSTLIKAVERLKTFIENDEKEKIELSEYVDKLKDEHDRFLNNIRETLWIETK